MSPPGLLAVCITAFISVFALLALLAGVMQAITAIFPQIRAVVSVAHVAAISTTFQTLFPGSKVTCIEEIK